MAFGADPATRTSLSEINVTPLVDVMLVLLIIFMVAAPILQTGIEVNLPRTRSVKTVDPENLAVVTIGREEVLYYRSKPIQFHLLGERLRQDVTEQAELIYVQADEDVRVKTLFQVLDEIRVTGFENVSLVTRPLESASAGRP
jgi:biopolymer transport protein TolR